MCVPVEPWVAGNSTLREQQQLDVGLTSCLDELQATSNQVCLFGYSPPVTHDAMRAGI